MNIVTNEKTIQRNKRIGSIATIGSILLFGAGIWFTTAVKDPVIINQYIWVVYGTLIIGFIGSQIGISLGNRFGRTPRMDERVSAALKGMTKDYTLYHYVSPASHLLVGPAGIWALETYHQRGTIVYEKNRYQQKGGGLLLGYLKIFAQEGLGRPDLDVESEFAGLKKLFKKEFSEDLPPLNAALVFLDPRAEINAEGAPYPALKPDGLKDLLRKAAKTNPLPAETIQRVNRLFHAEE
ncbi:MAG: hypothetical protein CO094_08030 [Anaerolineae bacterium CG_4_9_14_3_um_filter_57_17]|nr:hypothetical protein [bacterium]NCT20994.1 hypothetical protein [bacterium]OIO85120.1 MAG: hypothetical protein AUK01_07175 [Anaerolineae bacterium CG2_30_57_67]PJB66161.1 MAG: hypothetical protein CO094_08030 [Anaerolineae bacterium CG_4_9_14_3_um_filter_57_17]